ncbi:predicted protein [Botrytis cinerea T4]|uniref:Uncharacterized protein n=1 Tax=Botryotinia fuckeliana (strain T4) TaxID=999810 RepID=G2XY47_BOTF4|nr:predicted protein [Botrytis cinerea T4]
MPLHDVASEVSQACFFFDSTVMGIAWRIESRIFDLVLGVSYSDSIRVSTNANSPATTLTTRDNRSPAYVSGTCHVDLPLLVYLIRANTNVWFNDIIHTFA